MFILVAPGAAAANLPIGFTAKGGGHWIEDPRGGDRELQPCWELEIEGPLWRDGRLSLVGSMVGTKLDSARDDGESWTADSVDYYSRHKFQYSVNGGRIGIRLRPWPNAGWRPYVTAGGAYYQYEEEIWTETTATWYDVDSDAYVTRVDESTRHDRQDHGLYPWAALGLELPVGGWSSLTGQMRLLVEAQYEWEKDYREANVGGLMVMTGLRFRF